MDEFFLDYSRFTTDAYKLGKVLIRVVKNYDLRLIWVMRQYQKNVGILKKLFFWWLYNLGRKYGIEIVCENVGGIRLIHPFAITINGNAKIGENVTIYKGVTIGEIQYGKRKGSPIIGNNVTLFPNSTVCGNVHIGDDVIIAAGAWVNFDVSSGSTVVGNPGIIHKRKSQK